MSDSTLPAPDDQPAPVGDKLTGSETDSVEAPASEFVEGDHTIVSDGPIVSPSNAYAGLRPRDLGKALVGQTIDGVLLEEFVGGGGMGAVFRGRDTGLQRTVAVKVLAAHDAAGGDVSKRFEIEAQSSARLDHPNIARIYHTGEDHGLEYITFEFVEGENLRDLVNNRGPQPVRLVVSYAIQLAGALSHAWERHVVHRDIKPSNIIITPTGQAKLVDMGLARVHKVGQPANDLTATGATLGTFDYIAPEQARDPRQADIRSDIYSLGCTLFFSLTGNPPFPEGTALQKLLQHQGDDPPNILIERPDVPRPLARIIGRMLAKRPGSRQQDPSQLLAELLAIAAGMGIAPAATVVPNPIAMPQAPWRRHTPWVASVVLLAGFAAVAPVLWAPQGEAPFDEILTTPQPMDAQQDGPTPIDDPSPFEPLNGGDAPGPDDSPDGQTFPAQ